MIMARHENKYAGPRQGFLALVMRPPDPRPEGFTGEQMVEGVKGWLAKAGGIDGCADLAILLRTSLHLARIVEAKPGCAVVALPAEGSSEADELTDACAEAMYNAQLWPTADGKPTTPWAQFKVWRLEQAIALKVMVMAALTCCRDFADRPDWAEEKT